MDFAHTEAQQQIRTLASDLAAKVIAPAAAGHDREQSFPRHSLSALAKQGLLGMTVPPPLGGAMVDSRTFILAVEEVGRACASTAFMLTTHCGAALTVLAMGSPEQKQTYLGPLARGEKLAAVSVSEPGGGSNPMAIACRAAEEGEDYIINGTKAFASGAGEVDVYVVLVRTGDQPGPGSISALLLDRDTPGLTIGKPEAKLGMRGVPTCELVFDGCRVPTAQRLGPPGAGLGVLGIAGGLFGLGASAIALGMAQGALDTTKQHLRERVVAGNTLGSLPLVQARFADMLARTNAARALLQRAAYDRDTSPPGLVPTVLQAKVFVTETALEVIDAAIQLHGFYGYSNEAPLERCYRDARALVIHFGVNDVMRTMLAQAELG